MSLIVLAYVGGLLLGWSVGANDSANMFGTAVGSRMVHWRSAAILIAIFVVLGAGLQGGHGIATLSELAGHGVRVAVICTWSAALTVILMSLLRIPVSTSQMFIAALLGVGAVQGQGDWQQAAKVLISWLASPFGAMLLAVLFYHSLAALLRWWRPTIFVRDPVLRLGLVVFGCYGAYALGANGVAVVSAVFTGDQPWMLGSTTAALLGGLAIGVGALTFSKPVMMTVGTGVVKLDAFTALVAVMSLAVTVHFFAWVGVPVSTSQAIIGALLGIGLVKGLHVVQVRTLRRVLLWWLISPLLAAGAAIITWYVSGP